METFEPGSVRGAVEGIELAGDREVARRRVAVVDSEVAHQDLDVGKAFDERAISNRGWSDDAGKEDDGLAHRVTPPRPDSAACRSSLPRQALHGCGSSKGNNDCVSAGLAGLAGLAGDLRCGAVDVRSGPPHRPFVARRERTS